MSSAKWEKRRIMRADAIKKLNDSCLQYENFNDGAHLRVSGIDFWPGTGLWKDPANDRSGFGVESLVEYVNTPVITKLKGDKKSLFRSPAPQDTTSIRDYFAGQFLTTFRIGNYSGDFTPEKVAQKCYMVADAMMKERDSNGVD